VFPLLLGYNTTPAAIAVLYHDRSGEPVWQDIVDAECPIPKRFYGEVPAKGGVTIVTIGIRPADGVCAAVFEVAVDTTAGDLVEYEISVQSPRWFEVLVERVGGGMAARAHVPFTRWGLEAELEARVADAGRTAGDSDDT
jgi:hypothetical protein